MSKNLFLAVFGLTLLLFSSSGTVWGQNRIPNEPLRTVDQAVDEAKAKGLTEITLGHWTGGQRTFEGLDGAIAAYSLVEAVLEEKRTTVSGYNLNSYLRFEQISKLAGPPPGLFHMPDHVPADMRHISGREFVLAAPNDGELVMRGVRVRSGNDTLEEFVVGRRYLLFVGFSGPEIVGLPFGLSGVFQVSDTNNLVALRPNGDVARAFKAASLALVADVEVYYKAHAREPGHGQVR